MRDGQKLGEYFLEHGTSDSLSIQALSNDLAGWNRFEPIWIQG